MIPLHHFIAEGCIPDFNQPGLSLASDGKAEIRSCAVWTLTETLEVGSKA